MKRYDLIVIGAGPAGAEAAITARNLGLEVKVVDESTDGGGQIYRPGSSSREGNSLRQRLRASGADLAFDNRVWTIAAIDSGFEIGTVSAETSIVAQSNAVIVASGALERFYPRPGWTLPGVIGLGAATVMMKAHHVLPGRRVLVAGPGPLAPLVANLILENGGTVAALVDPNPRGLWLRALSGMASRPGLLLQGARWIARLVAKGVPILHGWDIRSIEGKVQPESVTLTCVDADWKPLKGEQSFNVDAVCFGYGLFPSTEFYRLLGAELGYDDRLGGWIPRIDDCQRTTVAGLYAAGDSAAVYGVAAAPFTGRIAALTAALDLGKMNSVKHRDDVIESRAGLARACRFSKEIAGMMRPRASAMLAVPAETVVCRCEDVTLQELRTAIDEGSREINALKAVTRCGMGPCGGRMCGEAAAAIMQCAGVDRSSIGYWTARPPIRPVSIGALTGTFEYSDIPIREPAPL